MTAFWHIVVKGLEGNDFPSGPFRLSLEQYMERIDERFLIADAA